MLRDYSLAILPQALKFKDSKLGFKCKKLGNRQWFCEDVGYLVSGEDVLNTQSFLGDKITNKVKVNIEMFRPRIKNMICQEIGSR